MNIESSNQPIDPAASSPDQARLVPVRADIADLVQIESATKSFGDKIAVRNVTFCPCRRGSLAGCWGPPAR